MFNVMRFALAIFTLVFIITPGISFSGPIDDLQPGHWYEVQNSRMLDVAPDMSLVGCRNPARIIIAWNSGAYDTMRDRLIVWGGGHGDYGGNEIYAFDIITLQWIRITDPSPGIPCGWNKGNFETYGDGNPGSRHTYDALAYLPSPEDRFISTGGSLFMEGGRSSVTWTFDFSNLIWESKNNPIPERWLGSTISYDPATKHIFYRGEYEFYEYDPDNDNWTLRANVNKYVNAFEMTSAIDPVNRLFVEVGNGHIRAINLNTWEVFTPSTTGNGSAITGAWGPGFEYDSHSKKFVAWTSGTSVYTLDTTTTPWQWTQHTAAASNTVTPSTPTSDYRGTYGRFRYIPSKNAFIMYNNAEKNVFFYKLSSGSGSPPPIDVTPPNVSISNPVDEATITSVVEVSSSASDNISVAGVQFKLDGANLGAEDTTSPYSVNWNTNAVVNGSHILSAVARDAQGNTGTAGNITVTVLNDVQPPTDGQIDIPLGTWVAVPGPAYGEGVYCGGGCKHMRLTHNPDDGRIYFDGGDYGGPIGLTSGRNEVYSYSIYDNKWEEEYPYCGAAGDVQPSHPDETGWVYDTLRQIFWMIPGYMGNDQNRCSASTLIRSEIMTFNPATKKWDFPNRNAGVTGSKSKFAQYDPDTDTIIRFVDPAAVHIYDIAADTWTEKSFSTDMNNVTISSNAKFGSSPHTAIDLENRLIYFISALESRLYRYHMNSRDVEFLIDTPVPVTGTWGGNDLMHPVWDSVNKVLLWPQIFDFGGWNMKFHVYHPDTNTWETDDSPTTPSGLEVGGNTAVFDPYQNAILLMGGSGESGTVPYNTNLFLYRYGNGSGTPPPPPSYQCSDGTDNDGDGLTDYPQDPGCESTTDNNENNASPPPSGSIINNLTVQNGKVYQVVADGLTSGSLTYIDRSITFTSIPSLLEGTSYIKTANNDKGENSASFISFEVDRAVTVYVAYDNRIAARPTWMASFTDTGDDLLTSDTTLSLYAKSYSPGWVILGGNENGAYSMYSVAVKQAPGSSDTTFPSPPSGLRKKLN